MNTNVNTVNTDANNEAAKTLADMFDGDTRPTLLTDNETEYTWDIRYPDFTITRGDTTVTARAAHIDR